MRTIVHVSLARKFYGLPRPFRPSNRKTGDRDMPVVPPPPATFNFAAHLLALNAQRGDKTAYIDDQGALSYAQLADGVRREVVSVQSMSLSPATMVSIWLRISFSLQPW